MSGNGNRGESGSKPWCARAFDDDRIMRPRQEALKQASRYALRKAINNVLKGRES